MVLMQKVMPVLLEVLGPHLESMGLPVGQPGVQALLVSYHWFSNVRKFKTNAHSSTKVLILVSVYLLAPSMHAIGMVQDTGQKHYQTNFMSKKLLDIKSAVSGGIEKWVYVFNLLEREILQ